MAACGWGQSDPEQAVGAEHNKSSRVLYRRLRNTINDKLKCTGSATLTNWNYGGCAYTAGGVQSEILCYSWTQRQATGTTAVPMSRRAEVRNFSRPVPE